MYNPRKERSDSGEAAQELTYAYKNTIVTTLSSVCQLHIQSPPSGIWILNRTAAIREFPPHIPLKIMDLAELKRDSDIFLPKGR